jgi:hypothetical protein
MSNVLFIRIQLSNITRDGQAGYARVKAATGEGARQRRTSGGHHLILYPTGYTSSEVAAGLQPATLYDAMTGAVTTGSGIPEGALMPSFSPDGRRLVFNDLSISGARGLVAMDYDVHDHKATGYKVLVQEPSAGELRPGWPFFLPDNKAVVFVRTPSPSFSSFVMSSNPMQPSSDELPQIPGGLHVQYHDPRDRDANRDEHGATRSEQVLDAHPAAQHGVLEVRLAEGWLEVAERVREDGLEGELAP